MIGKIIFKQKIMKNKIKNVIQNHQYHHQMMVMVQELLIDDIPETPTVTDTPNTDHNATFTDFE